MSKPESGHWKGTSGSIRYPGNDPTKPPGKGFEWRGGGNPGTREGSWYNPQSKEIWRSDFHHPGPIGPHWDYRDANGVWWRVYPDGHKEQKN